MNRLQSTIFPDQYFYSTDYSAQTINRNQHFIPLLITVLSLLLPVQAFRIPLNISKDIPPDIIPPSHPFMLMLDGPIEKCDPFNIAIDLSYFHIVSSKSKPVNQSISMFKYDTFGQIPYVYPTKTYRGQDPVYFHGGLPQLVDMGKHLELAEADIKDHFPVDQQGLGVINFDVWRPQWERNWGNMKIIYQEPSRDRIKMKFKNLTDPEAEDVAKTLFEIAAKQIFVQTIRLGKRLRPRRLWGFYKFPDCYNYDYNRGGKKYTFYDGECKDTEKKSDEGLYWLWKESTALFPTIYLDKILKNDIRGRWFVRHHFQEAMNMAKSNPSYLIPIYPYVRGVYKDNRNGYLSELDLVNIIGEAAARGAAGIVYYMGMYRETCDEMQQYMEKVVNPYLLNVTKATQLCSEVLCQSQGRCVRKKWDEDVFLHLDPKHYQIQQQGPGTPLAVIPVGRQSQEEIDWFDVHFDCICYNQQEPCRSVKQCKYYWWC